MGASWGREDDVRELGGAQNEEDLVYRMVAFSSIF